MSKGFDDIISKVSECSVKTVSVAVAEDSAVLEICQDLRSSTSRT